MKRPARWFWLLAGAVLLCAYAATALGQHAGQVVWEWDWPRKLFTPDGDPALARIIGLLRLPRVLGAILIGAALAPAGLVLQSVSRNPLADPFLLGISGGAALGVVVANALGASGGGMGLWFIPAVAFLGAQGATILVLSIARGPGQRVSLLGLVLGGVVINAFCSAIIVLLLTQFEPLKLRITTAWLAGGLGYLTWSQLAVGAVGVLVALVVLGFRSREINAFALGEEGARLVGVNASRVLYEVTWAASVLAGLAVSLGGLIGYIGLIVPHLVLMMSRRNFLPNLWLSALLGALVLLVADTLARTLLSPQEIPVGVLTALVGTPALLVLLRREMRR
ncbi:MAG: iron ABC transporter permease [Proteobacteria bacterium]|nr:iron ABC transporter permease [Pseudomonadota bacterium]